MTDATQTKVHYATITPAAAGTMDTLVAMYWRRAVVARHTLRTRRDMAGYKAYVARLIDDLYNLRLSIRLLKQSKIGDSLLGKIEALRQELYGDLVRISRTGGAK